MDDEQNHQKPSSAHSGFERRRTECSELIADWICIYEGNYGKEPTGATIAAYRIGLSDLRPDLLHKAFSACLKTHTFWPNVAEIRVAYRSAAEETIPFPALPVHDEWTDRDRLEFAKKMAGVWKTIEAATLTEKEADERRELLRKQAGEVKEKYKAKGAA